MNISKIRPLAKAIRFDEDTMWVDLLDGRTLGVPLAFFPRLLAASNKQLLRFEISGGGVGIHWDELDEDISVRHLLLGLGDQSKIPPAEEEKLRA